jgi:hypothetical protein
VIETESKSMLGRATGSYMRLEVIALLAALSIASTAPAQMRSPRQTTWRGTLITTAGLTGTFIARTHLTYGRDLDTTFYGHLRCRGAGCPIRHGNIALTVDPRPRPEGSAISLITFGIRGQPLYCWYVNNEAPPNLLIVGAYNCYSPVPPGPTLSSGTLNLAAYQNGQPIRPGFHAPLSS